ncbi:deoxyguanosinetriphosphate triphosphohydrolase [Actinomycetospora endophytica]|uniref:Deoxyguanosinetriphosphate triphosphohydrolase n=1 Tax=Actinomycetospora endophytica TaxID=2291215 RepID=A0ABS8PEH7_9PSEU|nr:deoxyguanosinetriphosphate triphosphohydrolase [Actinomycetospora endophytica]MCD2196327.1 deoxyguanosinetriphosphate triphosphohydrolase [Actinomycetospora endophytica]
MTPTRRDPRERFFPEEPKRGRDRRTPFARDRGRVLHSAALRRLAGKTQVVGPGEAAEVTGVPRTRLTHSLEVAQIGRGMAEELGLDPDVVDTAGLAHDIGHPPFGHNGEYALNAIMADAGGFEGNAQTLRLLARLEPKTLDDERCRGLNLTRATLDACMKYPWQRRPGSRKFGVYADDLEVFTWVRAGLPAARAEVPCLEAQTMDWADDVAYSVHDVEDAILAGRIDPERLAHPDDGLVALAAHAFGADTADLEAAAERLGEYPPLVGVAREAGEPGTLGAQVALKHLTSELVGRFVTAAVDATLAVTGETAGPDDDLVVPPGARAEVTLLKAAAVRWVMSDPERLAAQERERGLLADLVGRLHDGAPGVLDPAFRPAWDAASDAASRLRVVVDQVAVLTDAQARSWSARLDTEGPRRLVSG